MIMEEKATGKRKLVKCQVCGEIFDAALERCPVCGVGSEFFVPYEEPATTFRKNTDEVMVILGNGAAGISAAQAIRERNESCTIYMISKEGEYSYNRPMLTKSLSTLLSAEEIAIHDKSWYAENNITNILDTEVTALDVDQQVVTLADGTLLQYDKCIYALGAECFIPPFPGGNKAQVIAIRHFSDVKKIREMLPQVKNTVVIGGGVLGLEAAWEMSKSSKVAVIEVADKLMGRQLDDEAGLLMGEIIKGLGIDFRINAKITEITGEDKVTGVKLENGEFFPADLVIVSCGVRANTSLAKAAGIATDRAVIVNERMETNRKNVYACGDCAEYQGINYAIWPEALEMGKIAGANAAGEANTYEPVPAALTFEGMNTSLFAAGDNGKNPKKVYETVEYKDEEKKRYEKYYFHQDGLVGVILIGDTSKMVSLTEDLNQGLGYSEFKRKYCL
jgi:NAD(P)H-nitrite reductase large subunit